MRADSGRLKDMLSNFNGENASWANLADGAQRDYSRDLLVGKVGRLVRIKV